MRVVSARFDVDLSASMRIEYNRTVALYTNRARLLQADEAVAAIRRLPPRAALAREMRAIRRAEIVGSTALSGSALTAAEVDGLLDRGRALGDHAFGDYVMVRAYADAALGIGDTRAYPAEDPRPPISVDELRQLNARAVAGSGLRGGAWRQGNPPPTAGIVAPAAWLVAREVTTLLDRLGRGRHDVPLALWLARFFGRFARLAPFEGANGRTARLAANLMLRRLDAVPLGFERADRAHYPTALAAAEAGAPETLAAVIAGALVRACNRISVVAGEHELAALRSLAGEDYRALAKAAQRGRLQTVQRGGRYYTTAEWVAAYRATRRSAPARSPARPTA